MISKPKNGPAAVGRRSPDSGHKRFPHTPCDDQLFPYGPARPRHRTAEIDWMSERAARNQADCRHVQPAPGPDEAGGPAFADLAADADAFTGLRGTFAEVHGRPPALEIARISEQQCAAIDFLARPGLPFAPKPP